MLITVSSKLKPTVLSGIGELKFNLLRTDVVIVVAWEKSERIWQTSLRCYSNASSSIKGKKSPLFSAGVRRMQVEKVVQSDSGPFV